MHCLKLLLVLFLLLSLGAGNAFARKQGQALADSLLNELPHAKGDTNNVKLIWKIGMAYRSIDYKEAIRYVQQALALAEKLNWEKAISEANYLLGNVYANHSDYRNALICYNKALELQERLKDKYATELIYNNVAAVYGMMGDYPKTIEIDLKALKMAEEVGDSGGAANCLVNIGYVNEAMSQYKHAEEYYNKALVMFTAAHRPAGIALATNNLGKICMKRNELEKALSYFQQALAVNRAVPFPEGVDMNLCNMAGVYLEQKKFDQALDTVKLALSIARANHLLEGIAYDNRMIAEIYLSLAKESGITGGGTSKNAYLRLAKLHVDTATKVFTEIESLNDLSAVALLASVVDSASGDFRGAFAHYRDHKKLADSVFNLEKDKKITQATMQFDFDKREAARKVAQDKKDVRERTVRYTSIAGMGVLFVFLVVVSRQRNKVKKEKANVEKEKARSDELLLNILPAEVAAELKEKGMSEAKEFDQVSVLFTDFVGFTLAGEKMKARELVHELHTCFKAFDEIASRHGIEKIKTIGDAYLAVAGLPVADLHHAESVVKAAIEISTFMEQRYSQLGDRTFRVRIGIHSGNVVAGIVGVKKFAYDIWGDTVNTAARMEQNSEAGRINISEATYELVKDQFSCQYRGEISAKNKGMMKMYYVN